MLRRLELLGCIRRVSAQAEVSGILRSFPSVKFIREPQSHELESTWSISFPERITSPNGSEGDLNAHAEGEVSQGGEVEGPPSTEHPVSGLTERRGRKKGLKRPSRKDLPQRIASLNGSEGDANAHAEGEDNQGGEVESPPSTQHSVSGATERRGRKRGYKRLSRKDLPQWDPNKAVPNLIFDIVDAAGTEGISTMVSTNKERSLMEQTLY